MEKFEAVWSEDWKYYVRYVNDNPDFCNKSYKKEIPNKYEYYEPNSSGIYKYILDQDINLSKRLGFFKDAKDKFGVRRPDEIYIRDNYWKDKYNLSPKIWYIDIETRSNTFYINNNYDSKIIEIRHCGHENTTFIKIGDIKQNKKISASKLKQLEYKDQETNEWLKLSDHEAFETQGFPEPKDANEEITLIQVFDSKLNTMFVFGTRPYEPEPGYDLEYPVKYILCSDEIDLLTKYFSLFNKIDPLIIYAWNGENFDYPYIFNRLKKLNLNVNMMSNYGKCDLRVDTAKDERLLFSLRAPGHYYIDLLTAYKKFTYEPLPSYALDFIANKEVSVGKVDHSEFTTFDGFYTGDGYYISETPYDDAVREEIRQLKIKENNKTISSSENERLQKLLQFQFVYYGIIDVYLLKRIDDKLNLSNIMLSMSQKMGCALSDTLTTLKPWACYIANVCYEQNLALPKKTENEKPNIIGGFVRDPIAGKHQWVLSEDYNSMYPMNMVGFNMSPDTFVPLSKAPAEIRSILMQYFNDQDEDRVLNLPQDVWDQITPLLQKYQLSMGINGALFDISKEGIIPNLVWNIYTQRKADKKIMLKYEKQKEIIADILEKSKYL